MSRRNKLAKFAEIGGFPNVYENFSVQSPQLMSDPTTEIDLKGRWAAEHFGNDKPITLELACGRGEYTLGLARRFPDRNFIGVDIKGARIWKGARTALREGLENAAFLRTRIECIDAFFTPGEIQEIWITFPDPFPRVGQKNRRLTSPFFMEKYAQLLSNDGILHLKTDNTNLFLYSLSVTLDDSIELLTVYDDIDQVEGRMPELDIPTYYENIHRNKGAKIKYFALRFN